VIDDDLLLRPAGELAGLIRSGELTAAELTELALARIGELDAALNAFVDVDADGARSAAAAVAPGDPRPLAGVPVAVKGNRAVAGLRLTQGAALTGDAPATYDHNVVRRLRAAGAVLVGTTTLPEYGILPVTEGRRFGPTRNPWDPGRTPGGSSGGSAAAVAAGMVPLAHGNDGGGSLRIPASCCGLVGLKPQRGRISLAPEIGEQFLGVDGVLTRTVAETAALLDVLAGPEPGDSSWAPPPAEPFAVSASGEPGRLRVALTCAPSLDAVPVDPACIAAVQDTGRLLEDLGHEVVPADPPWGGEGMFDTFAALFGPAVSAQIAAAGLRAGHEPREEDMEPLSWWVWRHSTSIDAVQASLAAARMQAHARAVVTWAQPYDAILCPTLAEPPVPIGTIDPLGPDPRATFMRSGAFTPFTAISNVTGSPAISLPLAEHPGGLPLGVQLIGRPAGEGPLLALAAQLEAARPWSGRRVSSVAPNQTGVENRPWPT
jgi:amidase